MSQPYEALFRWNKDGKFSGGHTIRFNDAGSIADPMPLGKDGKFPFADIAAEINLGLINSVDQANQDRDAQIAVAVKEKDDTIAKYQAVIEALQHPEKTKEDAIAELDKEQKQRKIEELTARKKASEDAAAAAQAEIDALNAGKP